MPIDKRVVLWPVLVLNVAGEAMSCAQRAWKATPRREPAAYGRPVGVEEDGITKPRLKSVHSRRAARSGFRRLCSASGRTGSRASQFSAKSLASGCSSPT